MAIAKSAVESIHNLHSCHHGCFVHKLLDQREVTRKRGYLVSRMSHLVHQIVKLLFCWDHSLMIKNTNIWHIFTLCAHLEMSIHIPFSHIPLSPVFQVPDYPVKPLSTVHASVSISTFDSLFFLATWIILSTGRMFVHHCPLGTPWNETMIL